MNTSLTGKRVLVTGATGFIGGHVARRLHAEGAQVMALEHTPGKGDRLAEAGIEVLQGSITDHARMDAILSNGVHIVMHIAAWLRGRPFSNYESVNVHATRYLAEASAAAGVERIVFTSSIAVYGAHGDRDVDETSPIALYGDPYGDSKIRAEQSLQNVARRTSLAAVVVRPGMVFGPGSRGWTKRIARLAMRGQCPIIDGGRGTSYPIYIDNLVDLLLLCTAHPDAVGETFNGVDDGPVTLEEFLSAHMKMIPTDRAIRLPGWIARFGAAALDPFVPGWKLIYIADQLCGRGMVLNRRAKEVLGWSPRVTFDEGMHRSEMWLRAEGILPSQ